MIDFVCEFINEFDEDLSSRSCNVKLYYMEYLECLEYLEYL